MLPVHELDVPAAERRFHRLSGRPALDLVATVGERWRRRFERLRSCADVDRWIAGAGFDLATPATAADLAAIRELRGAVELLVVAAIGGTVTDADRRAAEARVTAAARGPRPRRVLADGALRTEPVTPAEVVTWLADDALDLLGGPDVVRIRECAADDCALVFLDTSRPGTRRWCSMRGCGNRAKVQRHRGRTATSEEELR